MSGRMTAGAEAVDGPDDAGRLRLVLPLPPSINHLYASVQGRRVLSREGRAFKAFVAETMERWLEEHPDFDAQVLQQRYLALRFTFYFATALRRDLDSGLKIAQDALCEALGVNDNLVVDIHLRKRVDRHCPRMEVLLTALLAEQVDLEGDEGHGLKPLPAPPAGRTKRRRRRKQRSLEELAARHRWELEPMANDEGRMAVRAEGMEQHA